MVNPRPGTWQGTWRQWAFLLGSLAALLVLLGSVVPPDGGPPIGVGGALAFLGLAAAAGAVLALPIVGFGVLCWLAAILLEAYTARLCRRQAGLALLARHADALERLAARR